MSNTLFAELDALIVDALSDAGLADACTFIPSAGLQNSGSCVVYRDVAEFSRSGIEFRKDGAIVHLLRAGISQRPRDGDVLIIGGDEFVVRSITDQDESRWILECST